MRKALTAFVALTVLFLVSPAVAEETHWWELTRYSKSEVLHICTDRDLYNGSPVSPAKQYEVIKDLNAHAVEDHRAVLQDLVIKEEDFSLLFKEPVTRVRVSWIEAGKEMGINFYRTLKECQITAKWFLDGAEVENQNLAKYR
jgi:hypothetical protein